MLQASRGIAALCGGAHLLKRGFGSCTKFAEYKLTSDGPYDVTDDISSFLHHVDELLESSAKVVL